MNRRLQSTAFAKRTFLVAAVYGLIVLLPQYFLEAKNGRDFPPPITHTEYYYGFVGIAIAWQIVFLIIATDPDRYRLLILTAILEKASFGIPVVLLFSLHRVSVTMFAAGFVDLVLGFLFSVAYIKTRLPQ